MVDYLHGQTDKQIFVFYVCLCLLTSACIEKIHIPKINLKCSQYCRKTNSIPFEMLPMKCFHWLKNKQWRLLKN